MKTQILFGILALALNAVPTLAATPADKVAFRCVTTMPTTSYVAETANGKVKLTMVNHNGTPFMPIHEGIVVPNDFDFLKMKAAILTKIGDHATVEWPLENCEMNAGQIYGCYRGGATKIGGLDVESFALRTHRSTYQMMDEQSSGYHVTLSVLVDLVKAHVEGAKPGTRSMYFDMDMEYFPSECQF